MEAAAPQGRAWRRLLPRTPAPRAASQGRRHVPTPASDHDRGRVLTFGERACDFTPHWK